MTDLTLVQRWRRALSAARKAGVHVKTNVDQCCGSCTRPEDIGLTAGERKTTPYAYFLRSQGRRVRFTKTGDLHPSTRNHVYFSWANGAATVLAAAFRQEGFTVEWDGTDACAVGVHLRPQTGAPS